MKSNERMKGILFAILVFGFAFFFASGISNDILNTGKVAQISIATCSNTLPSVINGNFVLCAGNYQVASPITVTQGSTLFCNTNAVLNYRGIAPNLFNGVVLSTSSIIRNCNLNGKFSNAIWVPSSSSNALARQNRIDGAIVGIGEEYQSNHNSYSSNTIVNTGHGYDLKGNDSAINGGVIQKNKIGVFIGTPSQGTPYPFPANVCSSINYGPTPFCTLPDSGLNQKISFLSLSNNDTGIETYGVENQIFSNQITSNLQGIVVNAIHIGSETDPNGNFQEYFSSGVKIHDNTIRNNRDGGILLNGLSLAYYFLSQHFWHQTLLMNNIIEQTPAGKQSYGIVLGAASSTTSYPSYHESTIVQGNTISGNGTGFFIRDGGGVMDVLDNTITNNAEYGILVGEAAGFYTTVGAYRFLMGNFVNQNGKDGLKIDYGGAYYTQVNQFNQNGKRGFYIDKTEDLSYKMICNDLSSNGEEGFYYNGAGVLPGSHPENVYEFSKNRVINNGADGVRMDYFTTTMPGTLDSHVSLERVVNNHVANNAGKGISYNGWFGGGEFANNIVNNAQQPATDSGANWENMWDEKAYAKGYNQSHCPYHTVCTYTSDCGSPSVYSAESSCVAGLCECAPGLTGNAATNSCGCYENAPSAIGYWSNEYLYYSWPGNYSPVGNYWGGATGTTAIPPSQAPPIISCTQDSQCPYKNCNLTTNQCGNYDTLSSHALFTGYYRPGLMCDGIVNYYPFNPSFFPEPPPKIGTAEDIEGMLPIEIPSEILNWCKSVGVRESMNDLDCRNKYADNLAIEKNRLKEMKK